MLVEWFREYFSPADSDFGVDIAGEGLKRGVEFSDQCPRVRESGEAGGVSMGGAEDGEAGVVSLGGAEDREAGGVSLGGTEDGEAGGVSMDGAEDREAGGVTMGGAEDAAKSSENQRDIEVLRCSPKRRSNKRKQSPSPTRCDRTPITPRTPRRDTPKKIRPSFQCRNDGCSSCFGTASNRDRHERSACSAKIIMTLLFYWTNHF